MQPLLPESPESLAMHRRALAGLNAFMKMEAAGGIVLVLATVVAMVVAMAGKTADASSRVKGFMVCRPGFWLLRRPWRESNRWSGDR